MKIPSLIKTPNHQRFYIKPRYYDPVKEDVENRERLIIAEIESEKKKGSYVPGKRLANSFDRKMTQKDNSSVIRFLFVILLFGGTMGYLYVGPIAIYIVFGAIAFGLIFQRLKRS
jgi:hypothetical protein